MAEKRAKKAGGVVTTVSGTWWSVNGPSAVFDERDIDFLNALVGKRVLITEISEPAKKERPRGKAKK